MGIPGLLRELNALVGRDAHISTYSGKRVAVDASGWLHRACYSCALDLLQSPATTTGHLVLLRAFLALLASYDIKATLVFDGAQLPAKGNTAAARDASKLHHRTLALQYLHSIPPNPELALFHAQKAMSVSGEPTARFIALARELSVNYVVAPYEADAQLTWLMQRGLVDACITEDSDLMAFGCDRVFVRLQRSGHGRELVVSDLISLTQPPPPPPPPPAVTVDADADSAAPAIAPASSSSLAATSAFLRRLRAVYLRGDLLGMCVMSGCDYLPSLKGVGLRTAAKWWDDYKCIELILLQMKRSKSKAAATKSNKRKSASGAGGSAKRAATGGGLRDMRREWGDSSSVLVLDDEELPTQPSRQQTGGSQEQAEESSLAVGPRGAVDDEDEESVGNRGKDELYDGYAFDYHRAVLSFRHQLVYDTQRHCYCHLNLLPPSLRHLSSAAGAIDDTACVDEVQALDTAPQSSIADASESLSSRMSLSARHDAALDSLDFLGAPPPPHLMHGLVTGAVDPRTLRPYEERKLTDFFSTQQQRSVALDQAAAEQRLEVDAATRAERGSRLVPVDREYFAELLDADVDIPAAAASTAASASDGLSKSLQRGESVGGGGSSAKRPMSRSALDKERRLKEERRSTGGGLMRFFGKPASVTALVCSSPSATIK